MTPSIRLLSVLRSLISGNFPELIAAQPRLLLIRHHSTASPNCLLFISMTSLRTLHLDLFVGLTLKDFPISYLFSTPKESQNTLLYSHSTLVNTLYFNLFICSKANKENRLKCVMKKVSLWNYKQNIHLITSRRN